MLRFDVYESCATCLKSIKEGYYLDDGNTYCSEKCGEEGNPEGMRLNKSGDYEENYWTEWAPHEDKTENRLEYLEKVYNRLFKYQKRDIDRFLSDRQWDKIISEAACLNKGKKIVLPLFGTIKKTDEGVYAFELFKPERLKRLEFSLNVWGYRVDRKPDDEAATSFVGSVRRAYAWDIHDKYYEKLLEFYESGEDPAIDERPIETRRKEAILYQTLRDILDSIYRYYIE
jgi:hypothetical protein